MTNGDGWLMFAMVATVYMPTWVAVVGWVVVVVYAVSDLQRRK